MTGQTQPPTTYSRLLAAIFLIGIPAFLAFCFGMVVTKSTDASSAEAAQTKAATEACRTWDLTASSGLLASEVFSVTEAAKTMLGDDSLNFDDLLADHDRTLDHIRDAATIARTAAGSAEVPDTTYRALRDLANALDTMAESVSEGEALDVARVRASAIDKALSKVDAVCRGHA